MPEIIQVVLTTTLILGMIIGAFIVIVNQTKDKRPPKMTPKEEKKYEMYK